ncbi:MAG: hypothetical protein E7634_03820 [Ruminococcaceae bacterium]|nr:hypothetical protein [Oscillospiraceae bacterium]
MARLLLYYVSHTFINSIKKLFRTWVIVFILVCFAIGIVLGVGGGIIGAMIDDEISGDTEDSEYIEDTEIPVEDGMPEEYVLSTVDMLCSAVILIFLFTSLYGADKNGTSIFNMADVNILFCAPMKPQTVLLFKTLLQMGLTIASSIYLAFQIPNLVLNLGVPIGTVILAFAVLIATIIISKLVTVCAYTVVATHPRLRPWLKRCVLAAAVLIAGCFMLYQRTSALPVYEAGMKFFASEASRYIPIYGWLKGIIMYALEGNLLGALLCGAATVAAGAVIVFLTWHINADFYEDAIASAQKLQDTLQAAQENRRIGKERPERLKRDGLTGEGANVFLHKSIYNRRRFAHLGVFTKTMETYLAVGVGMACILRFAVQSNNLMIITVIYMFFLFFRSFDNPISSELRLNHIYLVPENPMKKLFYCLIAGEVDNILDFTVPYVVTCIVLMPSSIFEAVAWYLMLVAFQTCAGCMGAFLELSLSTGLNEYIMAMLQFFLKTLICVPYILFIVFGVIFEILPIMLIICACISVGAIAVMLYFSALLLERGRR